MFMFEADRIKTAKWWMLLSLLVLACQSNKDQEPLRIATAANMQYATQVITQVFTEETGIPCEMIVGSSGKLMAQIKAGAPFDIFLSANMKYPEELFQAGFTTTAPNIYAFGKLVLWTTKSGITPDLGILPDSNIRHIALANPETAPYGTAGLQVMQNAGFYESVKEKLVYGESIAQTSQFIRSGAAEIGFTAKSVMLSGKLADEGSWLMVDEGLYDPIRQGAVMVKKQEANPAAEQFMRFLQSQRAKDILANFGYETPSVQTQ
jgi:molybdate transport system substrate-binding protein